VCVKEEHESWLSMVWDQRSQGEEIGLGLVGQPGMTWTSILGNMEVV
jgi:hypothetical protein